MPAAIDLTGRQFGKLTVLRAAGWTDTYGGCRLWLCRCECGAELEIPQKRLPYAAWIERMPRRALYACPMCAGCQCVVCGATIPRTRLPAVTCEGECADTHRKARGRANWRQRVERDPHLPKRMHERRLAKAAADPEYAKKLTAWEKRRQERHRQRMRSDSDYAERYRARSNALYARHAERIQAERRAKLAAMSDAERQEWAERARRYCRRWKREQLQELKKDPAAHRRFCDLHNEYQRVRRELLRSPPVERACVSCGEIFASHKYRVICFKPECRAEYKRRAQERSRARKAHVEMLQTARHLESKMPEHYFTCPKCGGHYFGRDTKNGEPLPTVRCHGPDGDGDAWPDGRIKTRAEIVANPPRKCDWRGVWPTTSSGESSP